MSSFQNLNALISHDSIVMQSRAEGQSSAPDSNYNVIVKTCDSIPSLKMTAIPRFRKCRWVTWSRSLTVIKCPFRARRHFKEECWCQRHRHCCLGNHEWWEVRNFKVSFLYLEYLFFKAWKGTAKPILLTLHRRFIPTLTGGIVFVRSAAGKILKKDLIERLRNSPYEAWHFPTKDVLCESECLSSQTQCQSETILKSILHQSNFEHFT